MQQAPLLYSRTLWIVFNKDVYCSTSSEYSLLLLIAARF